MQNIYSPKVLDHYRHPRNTGKLAQPTHQGEELNPLCGDEIKVYISVKGGIIKDVKYEARGCALSIASASLLSEDIKGESTGAIGEMGLKDIKKMLGVEVGKAREQCVLLALNTIDNLL